MDHHGKSIPYQLKEPNQLKEDAMKELRGHPLPVDLELDMCMTFASVAQCFILLFSVEMLWFDQLIIVIDFF